MGCVEEAPKTTCPFTLYGQLIPTDVPAHLMKELEAELEHPTGINTVQRPDLNINGVLISRECGMLYEIKEAEGLKYVRTFDPQAIIFAYPTTARSQRFWRKVTTCASFRHQSLAVLYA